MLCCLGSRSEGVEACEKKQTTDYCEDFITKWRRKTDSQLSNDIEIFFYDDFLRITYKLNTFSQAKVDIIYEA